MGVFVPTTEIESQAVLINVPTDSKDSVSPQSPLSDLPQKNSLFETKKSLNGSYTSLKADMRTQKASGSVHSTTGNSYKKPQKKLCEPVSS